MSNFVRAQFVLPVAEGTLAKSSQASLGEFVRASFVLPVAEANLAKSSRASLGNLGCGRRMLSRPRRYPASSPYRASRPAGLRWPIEPIDPARRHRKPRWPVEPIDTPRRRTLQDLGFNWGGLLSAVGAGAATAGELVTAFKQPKFQPPAETGGAGQPYQATQAQQQLVYPQPRQTILGMSPTTAAIAAGGVALVVGFMVGGRR